MSRSEEKIVQYLTEAHATEQALVRELQAQISMTPRGRYRTALETHLRETRDHAERVQRRLAELGAGDNPLQVVTGTAQAIVGQAIALARAPLALVRGTGGEEKVLKNAKDSAAAEALEIATYESLERLARTLGDEDTAELAASIRADEEKMLARIRGEIPALTDAVVRAGVEGDRTYDIADTGAADTVREAAKTTKNTARKTTTRAKRASRQARKVPGVADAEGLVKGAVASEDDLPIADYGTLSASEVVERLPSLSQIDLAKVDAYERKHQGRKTVLDRIGALRAGEPWLGYDEANADEVVSRLREAGDELARTVRDYERAHKGRASVLKASDRELASA